MNKVRELPVQPASAPVPDSKTDQPPVIRRAEVVAFSLVALLVICVIAVLYVARAFFLPLVTAFVIGTMLSPAAKVLERYRVPRSISAVLIVAVTCAGLGFMIALISAPIIEWSTRLPELGAILKERLQILNRPLAIWHQLQGMFGDAAATGTTSLQLPKIDWVKPTLEFLSPPITELLLFFAILILFIASWPDLRRALIMTFPDRESRLRTLKILNEIEVSLGGYLIMVTLINMGVGIGTGLICAATGMPNPAGLGALAATLNYIPIIGPVFMFAILAAVGIITSATLSAGLAAASLFAAMTFLEGHFVTPAIIGRRLALNALAVFIALAFWTWLWGPMGAFLASPILIVGLILKERLAPIDSPQFPEEATK